MKHGGCITGEKGWGGNMSDYAPNSHSPPVKQSTDEWLDDYENASGITPKAHEPTEIPSWRNKDNDNSVLYFRYVGHRTTTTCSLAMDFETLDHELSAVKFFNIKQISSRGKKYPASNRGQFLPPPRGKFRKFWMKTTGKEPARWCRVHKTMRATLKGLVFAGRITHEIDSKGRKYIKLEDIWLK